MNVYEAIDAYGLDIISSCSMKLTKKFMQHGKTSVYVHSFNVACLCYVISEKLKLNIDKKSLVRGALLHDYFLYVWHINDDSHKWHGFIHARIALKNAESDFLLNDIEKDMILKHMFPLNLKPPKYKETVILCIADKILAICEILKIKQFNYDLRGEVFE